MANINKEKEIMLSALLEITRSHDHDFSNFIYKKNSKLWGRYLSKIRQEIQEFYYAKPIFNHLSTIDKVTKSLLNIVIELYCDVAPSEPIFKKQFKQKTYDEQIKLAIDSPELHRNALRYFCDIENSYFINSDALSNTALKAAFIKYIQNITATQLNRHFETALDIVCKEYVFHLCVQDESIREENFVLKAMPESGFEIRCIANLVNAKIIDLIAMEISQQGNYFEADVDLNQQLHTLQSSYEEQGKQMVNLQQKIKEVEEQNEKISLQYARTKQELQLYQKGTVTQSEYDTIAQQYQDLIQRYNKLKRLYDALNDKHETLKTSIESNSNIDGSNVYPEQHDERKLVDLNKRYLFLAHERAGFRQNIQETFPNAQFKVASHDPMPSNIDMVIMITSHITHQLYYSMKSKCENSNIPFIHCPNTNVDLIIDAISKYINNN